MCLLLNFTLKSLFSACYEARFFGFLVCWVRYCLDQTSKVSWLGPMNWIVDNLNSKLSEFECWFPSNSNLTMKIWFLLKDDVEIQIKIDEFLIFFDLFDPLWLIFECFDQKFDWKISKNIENVNFKIENVDFKKKNDETIKNVKINLFFDNFK